LVSIANESGLIVEAFAQYLPEDDGPVHPSKHGRQLQHGKRYNDAQRRCHCTKRCVSAIGAHDDRRTADTGVRDDEGGSEQRVDPGSSTWGYIP
jgi:hypothetical protein